MKALVYLRISQDRTGERAGVDRQRDDCLKRAKERGWEVVGIETDNDISASGKRRRPGFEAMLKAIEAGKAQVIIAWDLTRLQRSRRDEVRLYELCQKHNMRLALINGAELDFQSAAGRFVADSLGSVARLEIELKSDRQIRASRQAAAAGKRVGGRRPFGYDADGVTVRPAEAAAIKAGYEMALAGVPLAEIARRWNADGFTTGQTRRKEGHEGQPSPWQAYSVRMVLLNPRNAGLRSYKGEVMGKAEWAGIVPESTWRAADATLKHPDRRSGTVSTARRLLSGLARCGVCGSTVHAGGAARAGIVAYRCSGSMGHFSRMAEPVDEYVGKAVVAILSRPDAADLLTDGSLPDAEAMSMQAMSLRARLDSLAVDFADGALTASQLRTATERLREKLAEVEASMADVGRVDKLGDLVAAENVQQVWDAKSVPEKRAVIDLLMDVVIHPPGRGTRNFNPATVEIAPKK
ncbi:recombinase family protein [Arthrobacter globiformis]|uniref:recombinase family protein n=1 Tax=Arthrobacter globiformis TaxID=1665 RepID=UPI0027803337|nr:recombinase family protein [Arthrobacter globiformis]MDQ0865732.1 site-specific DNA recombinase [Arthrobacter globiformis]